ncbi:hypothetical protein ACHAWF_012383 [Thalassiosira exigua]
MQYRPTGGSPTTFNIGSGEASPLSSLADHVEAAATAWTNDARGAPEVDDGDEEAPGKDVIDVERSSAARAAALAAENYLRWTASTSLADGAARLLAWHLDRALPFFPPATASEGEVDYSGTPGEAKDASGNDPLPVPLDGEGLLRRRGVTACSAEGSDPTNTACLGEAVALPCASECATSTCSPSVFDPAIPLIHEVTEDCEVVLYTMALGYDVEEMALRTEFSDGTEQEQWMETTVCTLAFVPSESSMVKDVIGSVQQSDFEKLGVKEDDDFATKAKKLSGYIAHRGWLLVLLDDAVTPLAAEDMFLAKLAPARLFHETVRKAMFIDENFSHTPYPEDAQFLASETSRGKLKARNVMGPDGKGRPTKYRLPEEPQRRAVLLLSPVKQNGAVPLEKVTEMMINELGIDLAEFGGDEPPEIQVQREYYEVARSLINSYDLRSPDPSSRHKLEIKDFVRSRWIVHHLKLEEGHQLRCEWYREHARWNTHLDQLSFAYVMARRELVRRIVTRQPFTPEGDEETSLFQKVILTASDAHEWHPILSAEGMADAIHHLQMSPEAIPLNIQDLPENEILTVDPDVAFSDVGSTFYVRIMSDQRMVESRKRWVKARK